MLSGCSVAIRFVVANAGYASSLREIDCIAVGEIHAMSDDSVVCQHDRFAQV